MTEICPGLFIGDQGDYESTVKRQDGWWVVHACKEPYHRQLLGYSGRGAPKNHPEYYRAVRGQRLFLNLVDAPNPAYIPKENVDAALQFIRQGLESGGKVLVHCNRGESRSATIGLIYLLRHTPEFPRSSLADAEARFRQLYPTYAPAAGMRGFAEMHWDEYASPAADGG